MGFTTGLLGGLTLTYSLLYFSVYVHRQNRTHQSLLLRQQSRLLNSIVDPPEPEYPLPAYRLEQAGIEEQVKDRWNREVEGLVRKVQTTDWEAVRIKWEGRLGNVWDKVRGTEQVQAVEQRVRDGAQDLKENVQAGAQDLKKNVQEGAKDLKKNVISASQDLRENVSEKAEDLRKNVAAGAHDLKKNVVSGAERVRDGVVAQSERAKENLDNLVNSSREAKDNAKASAKETVHGKRLLDL